MGVSAHSVPNTLYIFGTMRKENKPEDNEELHRLLGDYLGLVNVPYVEVEGSFDKFKELSFLVNAEHLPEEAVMIICQHGKQECYMTIENHKHGVCKAILTYTKSGAREFIGYFRELPKRTIDALGIDYTYRKDVDKYWAVWPTDTTMIGDFEDEVAFALTDGYDALCRQEAAYQR